MLPVTLSCILTPACSVPEDVTVYAVLPDKWEPVPITPSLLMGQIESPKFPAPVYALHRAGEIVFVLICLHFGPRPHPEAGTFARTSRLLWARITPEGLVKPEARTVTADLSHHPIAMDPIRTRDVADVVADPHPEVANAAVCTPTRIYTATAYAASANPRPLTEWRCPKCGKTAFAERGDETAVQCTGLALTPQGLTL